MAYGAGGRQHRPHTHHVRLTAAKLWLALIRKRGIYVCTTIYMRVALFTTPIVLLTTIIALWLVLR
jgi:hypothetical protein